MNATTYPELETFRQAVANGELLLKRCRACGEVHYYPHKICPFCFSVETEWQKAVGVGTVYSFSVMRRAEKPYVIAYVTLDEGPTMLTNIIDADLEKLAIGQKVRLRFGPAPDGSPQPMFGPA